MSPTTTDTSDTFDEVLSKLNAHVPPPRTRAAKAAEATFTPPPVPAPAPPAPTSQTWFQPTPIIAKPAERKLSISIEAKLLERFKAICARKKFEQKKAIELMLQGFVQQNEG